MKPKHELWTDIEQEFEADWAQAHPEIRHDFANPEEERKYAAENGLIAVTDMTEPPTLGVELDRYLGHFYDPEAYGVKLEQVKARIERHKSLIASGEFLDEFGVLFERAVGVPGVKRRDIDILDYSLVHVAGAQLAHETQHVALGRIHMVAATHFFGTFADVLHERTKQNSSLEIYHHDDAKEVISIHDPFRNVKIHLAKLLADCIPNGGWKTTANAAHLLHEKMIDFVNEENTKGKTKKAVSTDAIDMTDNIVKWIEKYELLWRAYTKNTTSGQ